MSYPIPGVWPSYRLRGSYRDLDVRVPKLERYDGYEGDYEIPAIFAGKSADDIGSDLSSLLPSLNPDRHLWLDLRFISLVLSEPDKAAAIDEFIRRVPYGWAIFALPEVVENLEAGLSPDDAVVQDVSRGFPVCGDDRPDFEMLNASGMVPINRETIASWGSVPSGRMPLPGSREFQALVSIFLGTSQLPRILGYRVLLESWPGSFEELLISCVSDTYEPGEISDLLEKSSGDFMEADDANDQLFRVQRHLILRSENAALKTLALFRRREFIDQKSDIAAWLASFRGYARGLLFEKTLPDILTWGEDWSEFGVSFQ